MLCLPPLCINSIWYQISIKVNLYSPKIKKIINRARMQQQYRKTCMCLYILNTIRVTERQKANFIFFGQINSPDYLGVYLCLPPLLSTMMTSTATVGLLLLLFAAAVAVCRLFRTVIDISNCFVFVHILDR